LNTDTFNTTTQSSLGGVRECAVRNTGSSWARKLIFLALWLSVSLPLAWGVMKAWEDVRNLIQ
jgi:hypothetical protein